MLKRLKGLFSNDLSIDLGTANTLVYVRDKGIILDEPSVVAIKTHAGQRTVVAVGSDAKKMLGRTPGNISAIRPLKDGVIADFQVTEEMLKHFIEEVHEDSYIRPSPRILVAVPCQSTQVERRAIRESVLKAGAREVRLIGAHGCSHWSRLACRRSKWINDCRHRRWYYRGSYIGFEWCSLF